MAAQITNLHDLVTSLLESVSTTGDESVRNEISESLKIIGDHQPNVLLTAAHQYLLQNPRICATKKSFVLRAISTCLSKNSNVKNVDEQLVLLIINLATQEMTMTKDVDSDWAEASKEVLVTLARSQRFCTQVVDAALQKFPPGLPTSPHKYIVLTMATIAENNPFGLVPFLTDILSRTVPLLHHIKTDSLRCAWARAICLFCEAVRECETERPQEADESLREDSRPNSSLDDSHDRATYADQAEALYDVIFPWLYSKDPKTRGESAECIGELCLMIRQQKLIDEVKKIVTNLLPLYKRAYNETHMITQGVCRFLEAACLDDSCPLEPYLEDVLNALFPNACLDVDDTTVELSPQAIKNHSEAFRCFHVAATRFADRIVYYLLHKMQNVADGQKLGAINILRHLVNSSDQHMEDKRSIVMMGLKKLLASENTASIRVKRAIVQLCVALADHAYVDTEGGDCVIAFLVRNLVPPTEQEIVTKKLEVDVAGMNQLRTQCAQALHTISATCEFSNKLLWPYLLEFVCVDRYTPVVGDLFKCIRTLIGKSENIDFVTGFDNERVAGPHAVFARLFTCLGGAPLNGLLARRAREAGGLLTLLVDWFVPINDKNRSALKKTMETWENRLEPLLDELTTTTSNGEQTQSELRGRKVARWNDGCLSWLSSCIGSVTDQTWRKEIAAAMGKQLDLYKELSDEKAILLQCLGRALAKVEAKEFVVEHLNLMFKSTNHASPAERQGAAKAVGAIATEHTKLVLIELENISKWEHAKKSTGLFGFIKDTMPMRHYPDVEMVNLRATLMLSYGYLVTACPLDTVGKTLQHTVIIFLRHYFANAKQETVVREAILETMRLIAGAVHPQRVGSWKLDSRDELLAYVKDYVQSEAAEVLSSSIRLLACKATSALVQLEPPLGDKDLKELALVLTGHILPMCREKSGLKTLAYDLFDQANSVISTAAYYMGATTTTTATGITNTVADGPQGTPLHKSRNVKMEDDESATIMDATVHQFGLTLEHMIRARPTTATLTVLLKMLQGYYGNSSEHQRARAIDASVLVLNVYYQCADDITLGHATDFAPLSSLLGRLSPRLVDSLAHVRLESLATIHWAFRLAHMHKGHGHDADPSLFSYSKFAEKYLTGEGKLDGQTAKQAIKAISQVIECRLPQSQMQTYLTVLIDMLTDRQSQVSSAAAQLLTYSLAVRGSTLVSEAETLVATMLQKLSDVQGCVQTYTDLLSALVAFAAHQQQHVCDLMLAQPLPYTESISDAWRCLSRDRFLFPGIADYILELLTGSLDAPYETVDTGAGSAVKIVEQNPCQYVAAVAEIVVNGEPEAALVERLPHILAYLIHFICSVADTQFPVIQKEPPKNGVKMPLIITPELRRAADKPAGMAVAAIKNVLVRTGAQAIIEDMNQSRSWTDCLDKEQFINAITVLVRSISDQRPAWIAPLLRSTEEHATSECEPRRLAAVIVASALIRNPSEAEDANEQILVKSIRRLEESLTDPSIRIRRLCVRGLGDLSECGRAEVTKRYVHMSVEAAMAGLDDMGDRKDTVAMESILALNKLVSSTNDDQLVAILPQVLLKIRPCFEKESAPLRAASFSLFGELSGRVGEKCEDLNGHVHTNLVALLLHLNDENQDVRKSCAMAIYSLHQLLHSADASTLIERELNGGKQPPAYESFIKDVAMILTVNFPDKVNQYALATLSYFKSTSWRIRANAAVLAGHLLESLTPQLRATISKDHVFSGLVGLIKDNEETAVRVAAVRAISSLHQFD